MVGGAIVFMFDEWWRRYYHERLGKRAHTFRGALEEARPCPNIIETGVQRTAHGWVGDGCSTRVLAHFVEQFGGRLWGVDNDIDSINAARTAIRDKPATLVHSDSVEFLEGFTERIDLLYLDSYDYDSHKPGPSQEHHLREAQAAIKHLAPDAVVLIDDCDLPGGGKGGLVIPYLESHGFHFLSEAYQVLMRRNP